MDTAVVIALVSLAIAIVIHIVKITSSYAELRTQLTDIITDVKTLQGQVRHLEIHYGITDRDKGRR